MPCHAYTHSVRDGFESQNSWKKENFTLNRSCASESCTDGLAFTAVDSSHMQLADAKVACAALFMLLSENFPTGNVKIGEVQILPGGTNELSHRR